MEAKKRNVVDLLTYINSKTKKIALSWHLFNLKFVYLKIKIY